MSVRFNGIKHSQTPTLAKIIFLALLAACSTGWSTTTQKGSSATTTDRGLVAEDQAKGSDADVEITRKIRADLMADRNLSTAAKNIQVITLGSSITLKGVVASATERSRILDIASRDAGSKEVLSEIEIQKE